MTQPSLSNEPDVVVHGDRVRVQRVHSDLSHVEARHRFGGIDLPAALAGTLAGLGTLVLLAGLLSGAGAYGYQQGVRDADTVTTAGLIAGLLSLLVMGLVAGWVTGRTARYDGMRNGLLAALLLVLLTGGLGALAAAAGDDFDLAGRAHLPTWLSDGASTGRALLSALAGLVLLGLGAVAGGRVGAGWHRRVDDAVVDTRPGGLATYPSEPSR